MQLLSLAGRNAPVATQLDIPMDKDTEVVSFHRGMDRLGFSHSAAINMLAAQLAGAWWLYVLGRIKILSGGSVVGRPSERYNANDQALYCAGVVCKALLIRIKPR
jgi:hypothetical protein